MALCLASCEKNNEDELSGDDIIQFEDPNFLKALLCVQEIEMFDTQSEEFIMRLVDVDRNKDGQISVNEAQNVLALCSRSTANVNHSTYSQCLKSSISPL